MRNKIIVIYLIGVIIAWIMGFNWICDIKKEYNRPVTYGDITFITTLSFGSWLDVVAFAIVKITDSDIWDKPFITPPPTKN